ncbi:MAG: precorrin-3B C(17)-methyltransferase [Geminicoccaceae bacterium]|nr:precorrin-3B C(17)-methyltransferase [Geminicoccaceae bacterium]
MTGTVILAPGASALPLARRLQGMIPRALILAPETTGGDLAFAGDLGPRLRAAFLEGRAIVGVCAAGILIRLLAPALADKRAEPPVLAVDEAGRSVVPLLGGHRGANDLARRLAGELGAIAAITTAGDARFGLALDAPPPGWRLARPEAAKGFMARLLAGNAVRLVDPGGHGGWLRAGSLPLHDGADLAVEITHEARASEPDRLVCHPPVVAIGAGSERFCPPDELADLADRALEEAGVAPGAVAVVASLDLKAAEPAIHGLAERYGVPARFLDAATLRAEEPRLVTPSEAVRAEVGVAGVAEAAALAAAGPGGRLLLPKRKSRGATVALALAASTIEPARVGRARGRLSVVGIGPGGAPWRTREAEAALLDCDEAVGYGLYLDLAADLLRGRPEARFPLGGEADRCRHALKRAAGGLNVALVCSGDPGIFAMATLVEELVEATGDPAEKRVEVRVVPGVSAFQTAAARVGAPVGHDFCCVSLSDLLTPLPVIERRLEAAAAGDFVVALYNPVSLRRREALPLARRILLKHRPSDTPVVVARDLGRADERVEVVTLEALSVEMVDMLTLVLVGSSATRRFAARDGGTRVFTPRGYPVGEAP